MVDLFGRFGELRNSFLLKGDRNVLRYVFQTISGSGTEIEYHMLITINSTVVGLYRFVPQKIFLCKIFLPGGRDVETLGWPGRRERVLRRGGRVGAGGHPHGALQHSVWSTGDSRGHRYNIDTRYTPSFLKVIK